MIPLIETGGTPYEIGRDVGRAAGQQIDAAAASTRADLARATDPRVMAKIDAYMNATSAAVPELVDELRGMADGSEVPLIQLFVMNAAAELYQERGFSKSRAPWSGSRRQVRQTATYSWRTTRMRLPAGQNMRT